MFIYLLTEMQEQENYNNKINPEKNMIKQSNSIDFLYITASIMVIISVGITYTKSRNRIRSSKSNTRLEMTVMQILFEGEKIFFHKQAVQ